MVVAVLQLKVSLRTRAWCADVHIVLLVLESDVADGGLITVRKVQIWANITSEIIA